MTYSRVCDVSYTGTDSLNLLESQLLKLAQLHLDKPNKITSV